MLFRLSLVLLVLNLVVGLLGVQKVFADELERHWEKVSVQQIGIENANVQPTELTNRESAELAIGRLGGHLFKGIGNWFGASGGERQSVSISHILRDSEFDFMLSDNDILLNLSYNF